MPVTIDEIYGGKFSNPDGSPLNGGKILFQLSTNAMVTGGDEQIAQGHIIAYTLDSNGSVPGPDTSHVLWGNDQLTPTNTYYIVRLYNANGQLVAGPMNGVIQGTSPIDLGSVNFSSGAGSGGIGSSLLLQTNDVNNTNQALLDLKQGSNISLANVNGVTTITGTAVPITLQTNGTPNSNQSLLNIAQGSNMTISNSAGTTTITGPTPPLLQTNGSTNSSQTQLNLAAGTGISLANVTGTTMVTNSAPALPSAQIGDVARFNVNGDSLWDSVNFATKAVTIFANYAQGDLEAYGATKNNPTVNSPSHGTVAPTATDSGAYNQSAPATASTSTVLGFTEGANPNFGGYGFGAFYRWSLRYALGVTTNARFWLGITAYNTSGGGTEGQDPKASASFATNTPNRSTIAFRYSAGTDTTWKATTQVTGGSQTVVDTTVAVDTNPHNFEFTYDGTTVRFYIDTVLRASITTNIPAANANPFMQIAVVDNQNTNNAVSATIYHGFLSLK
jgi:hypothetical protein